MCKISTLKISSFIISDDEQNIKCVIAADLWSKKTLKFKNRLRENAIIIIIKYLRFEQMIKSGDQYINQLSLTPLHLFSPLSLSPLQSLRLHSPSIRVLTSTQRNWVTSRNPITQLYHTTCLLARKHSHAEFQFASLSWHIIQQLLPNCIQSRN